MFSWFWINKENSKREEKINDQRKAESVRQRHWQREKDKKRGEYHLKTQGSLLMLDKFWSWVKTLNQIQKLLNSQRLNSITQESQTKISDQDHRLWKVHVCSLDSILDPRLVHLLDLPGTYLWIITDKIWKINVNLTEKFSCRAKQKMHVRK